MKNKKVILFCVGIITLSIIFGIGYYVYIQKNQHLLQAKYQALSDFNSNNLDNSIKNAQELSNNDSTKSQGLLLLATSYVQKGSLEFKEKEYGDKAIETANQVLLIDPNNSEAYRIIGYANEIEQNYPEALKNYSKSISLNPSSAETLASRGHSYYLMGDNENAKKDFLAALTLDPNAAIANLNLARLAYNEADYKTASNYLSKITDPALPVVVRADKAVLSALIKEASNDPDGALTSFNEALALTPNSPYIMVNIAQVKMVLLFKNSVKNVIKKTDVEKLIADVDIAISINPNQTISYITLGKMKSLIGDLTGSKDAFNKAKEVVLNDISLNTLQKQNIQKEIEASLLMQIKEVKK